jgi:hypothetical protein
MRTRTGRTALVDGIIAGTIWLARPAGAQGSTAKPDCAPHFALFGGTARAENLGPENGLELGASGDFRWKPVPVPLRLSLSFSQLNGGYTSASEKRATASLELVMRPLPRKLGIRPYFLGGLGVGTRAGYSFWTNGYYYGPNGLMLGRPEYIARPRETWAFATAGMGLDIGRAFIQLKVANPVASGGPILIPLEVGFRFWD